jgi:hypothetical protein
MVQPQQPTQMSAANTETAEVQVTASAGMAVNDGAIQAPDQLPDAATAALAPPQISAFRCRMQGCNFTSKTAKALPADANAAKAKAYWQQQATQFIRHATHTDGHKGQAALFITTHSTNDNADSPWCAHLRVCETCSSVQGKHNWAKHLESKKHKKAITAATLAGTTARQPVVPPAVNLLDEHANPSYNWGLQTGTAQRVALDALSIDCLLEHQMLTFAYSARDWRKPLAVALNFTLNGLRTACTVLLQTQETRADAAAWAKLWQLAPGLLLAPDGKISRAERFRLFASGDWVGLLHTTLQFVDKVAAAPRGKHDSDRQRNRMQYTARQPGGIARASRNTASGFAAPSAQSHEALEALRKKHPAGPPAAELAATVAAGAAVAAAKLAAQETDHAQNIRRTFEWRALQQTVMRAVSDTAPGLSGLRILHLQQMTKSGGCSDVCNSFFKHLAWLAQTCFTDPDSLPDEFWALFCAARLSAVGEKARPIACGDTTRRIFGKHYCRYHQDRFADYFEGGGQYGVAAKSGAEKMGLTAQLIHEAGGVVLSIDGRNAFNALARDVMLRETAKQAPDLFAYASKIYAQQPSLRFNLDGQAAAVEVLSQQGVQQGDPLGPLLFALAMYPIMKRFMEHHQFQHLSLPAFLDDVAIGCLTVAGLASDLQTTKAAYDWLVGKLSTIGIDVNTEKTTCLLPADAATEAPAEQQDRVHAWAEEQLGGVKVTTAAGFRLVGVPVGSVQFAESFVAATLRDSSADRQLREIITCRDTQLSFTLFRLCYLSRATFLARNTPPQASTDEFRRFDATTLAAVAGLLQEPAATTLSGSREDGNKDDWAAAISHIRSPQWDGCCPIAFSSLQQRQAQLSHASGGLGVSSYATRSHAAYIGRTLSIVRQVLLGLPHSDEPAIRSRLLQSASLQGLRKSVMALRDMGLSAESMTTLFPPELLAWTTSPEDAAAVDAWSDWLYGAPAAVQFQLANRLQSAISHAVEKVLLAQYRLLLAAEPVAAVRLRGLARHLSMSSKGAAAFLSTLPCFDRHRTMTGHMYRESMRRWLDIRRPDPDGLCAGNGCAEPHTAAHACRCSYTGEQTFRHDAIKRMLFDILRSVLRLAGVVMENNMFADFGYPLLRMDITFLGGQCTCPCFDERGVLTRDMARALLRAANGVMVDVAVIDETGPTYLDDAGTGSSALLPGAAAAHKTQAKFRTYGAAYSPASHTLFAAVLEQSGAGSKQLHLLVKMLAKYEHERTDGAYPVSACVQRWRQRFSVTLQRAISESEARLLAKVRDSLPGQQSEPVIDRYKRVHLLRRVADLPPVDAG